MSVKVMLGHEILELANQGMKPGEITGKLNLEGYEAEIDKLLREQAKSDLEDWRD